ncbi:MAG TPA: CBS domain-containing protein [Thermoplasmatales archaeon]|nr:CBS domain-containing protein [Thermoplasmatales archaeon]HEX17067.1 CBS domain-containing protein [Thermoplasmatales archaeon]
MKREILVREAMRTKILTCSPSDTVQEVAKKMRKNRVGSSVVMSKGKPVGILTESDILEKVVAEGRDASRTKVEEVMSTPLLTIDPYTAIEDAMKVMSKHNVRRLPVVEKGKLIGIITEKDLFRISPTLIEMSKEWSLIEGGIPAPSTQVSISGKCEGCGRLSTDLREVDGRFLCEDCREG